jgi:uncharacterized OsmC-like protein
MNESREVVVRGAAAAFKQELSVGTHRSIADEPVEVGGGGEGPDPYELLLESLGACTSMTLGAYARRKQWPLTGVTVRLKHRRVYAEDCAHCDQKKGMIDRIERRLELDGALTDEQRQRLLQIADMCPVHRTLTSKIDIVTSLEAPEQPGSASQSG